MPCRQGTAPPPQKTGNQPFLAVAAQPRHDHGRDPLVLGRIPGPLQAENGCCQIALVGAPQGHADLIEEQQAQLRLVGGHHGGHRGQGGLQVTGCAPGIFAVVQDDGQDRGQRLVGIDGLGAAQILPQQSDVRHHPHGHVGIHRALEFDQQVDVQAPAAPPGAPDDIVLALAPIIADVRAIASVQGRQVQFGSQFGLGQAQQVRDQLGVGEEFFVGVVVVHGVISRGMGSPTRAPAAVPGWHPSGGRHRSWEGPHDVRVRRRAGGVHKSI